MPRYIFPEKGAKRAFIVEWAGFNFEGDGDKNALILFENNKEKIIGAFDSANDFMKGKEFAYGKDKIFIKFKRKLLIIDKLTLKLNGKELKGYDDSIRTGKFPYWPWWVD